MKDRFHQMPIIISYFEISAFFETINPLNGFDGKESLETYMWEQSLKVEPKDPDKMEFVVSSCSFS